MTKTEKKLKIGFFIMAFLSILFVLEKADLFAKSQFHTTSEKELGVGSHSPCLFEKEAQKYLDEIYHFSPDHFGTSKPKLIFNTSDNLYMGSKVVVGKEDGENITLYEKGFTELYGENCSDAAIARLQSTIAHEYAHHIDLDSGLIKKELQTESLEYSAELGGEHALFELVWNKENPKAVKIDEKEKEKVEELKEILASI